MFFAVTARCAGLYDLCRGQVMEQVVAESLVDLVRVVGKVNLPKV